MELIYWLFILALLFIFCKEASIVVLMLCLVSLVLAYIYKDTTYIIIPVEDNYIQPQLMQNY